MASPPAEIAALWIDSATGVDVRLRVAGPGARTLAFLVDWNIRLVLTLAWYAGAALAYNGRFDLRAPLSPNAVWFAAVVAPSAAVYFLYHYVLEIAMRGRTPGKRMVGVRIVSRDGRDCERALASLGLAHLARPPPPRAAAARGARHFGCDHRRGCTAASARGATARRAHRMTEAARLQALRTLLLGNIRSR